MEDSGLKQEFIDITIRVPKHPPGDLSINSNTTSEEQAQSLDGWTVQFSMVCPKHGTGVLLVRRTYRKESEIQPDDFRCQIESVLQLAEGVAAGTEGGAEFLAMSLLSSREPPMDPRMQ